MLNEIRDGAREPAPAEIDHDYFKIIGDYKATQDDFNDFLKRELATYGEKTLSDWYPTLATVVCWDYISE